MSNFRRVYLYTVALISLETTLWGFIGLFRTIAALGLSCTFSNLSLSLALITVSTPLFFLHWSWARKAEGEGDESSFLPRAIFLYAALILTLIPLVQNSIALLNRILIADPIRASCQPIIGGDRSWTDNLIAICFNSFAAVYFRSVLKNSSDRFRNSKGVRVLARIYRYIWVIYALVLTVISLHEMLILLTFLPFGLLGSEVSDLIINTLALMVVGVPLWVYTWNICQKDLEDPEEGGSTIRRAVLFIITLISLVITIIQGYFLLKSIGEGLITGSLTLIGLFPQMGEAWALGLPALVIWLYHRGWLVKSISALPDHSRRNSWKHAYQYPLSAAGLALTFIGVLQFLDFGAHSLFASDLIGSSGLLILLVSPFSNLIVGIPLWLIPWLSLQNAALDDGETGSYARRSAVRKFYFFLIRLISFIGAMITAIIIAGMIFESFVFGSMKLSSPDIALSFEYPLSFLLLFVIVFIYHIRKLRIDSSFSKDVLLERQQKSGVLILDLGDADLKQAITDALRQHTPDVKVHYHSQADTIPEEIDQDIQAVILSADTLSELPDKFLVWLKNLPKQKIILQGVGNNWTLQGLTLKQAAQTVRQIAEGEEIRISGTAPEKIILYVVLGILGLMLLNSLLQGMFYLF